MEVVMLLWLICKNMCSKQDKRCKILNMIARINEAKILVNHISCDCKCKFDSTTFNLNQKWNKMSKNVKTIRCEKKDYSWNSNACICENAI